MEKTVQLEAKDIKIKEVLSYFWKKAMKYKWVFIGCILLKIIALVCSVYEPVYSAKLLDVIEQSVWIEISETMKILYHVLLILGILWLIKVVTTKVSGIVINTIHAWWRSDISLECFEKLHQQSYRFFSNSFSGSLVRKTNKLSQSFSQIVTIFTRVILSILVTIPLMIYLIMKENVVIWIIFLVFWIIFCTLNIWFTKSNLKYERLTNELDSRQTGELSDTITNAFNVMTFASQKRELATFSDIIEKCRKAFRYKWNRMDIAFLWFNIITLTFRMLCLYICVQQRWLWNVSIWVIMLVQMYIGRFTSLLYDVEGVFRSLNQIIWESTEMLAILKTPSEVQDKTDNPLKIKKWKIEFKNVTFWYINNDVVIDDLNLIINPWEKVAIVGESGSWKTTLVKLLFRFFDIWDGEILIDGQNIAEVTQESLRGQISMVPQDALLFHRTIKENIAYWKPDATEKEILKASKTAKCHDFIENLPEWYESLVWERWIKLSWWERQRVAIARAILENEKILVLDEATSSLDSESEFLIQSAMDEVMKNKTSIVIAHRLSTIMKMDRIIVMDEWVIVEEWTHEELIKNKGWVYHKLRNIQSWWFITKDEWDKMNFEKAE